MGVAKEGNIKRAPDLTLESCDSKSAQWLTYFSDLGIERDSEDESSSEYESSL